MACNETMSTMKVLAAKFSLGNHEPVLNKAAEYLRLLNAKSTAGCNMTDTSKVVICLDLAATTLGTHIDQKLAARYSGLKAPSYCNIKKVVENRLEMNNEQISVSALCDALQCGGAHSLAQVMLDEYQKVSVTVDPTLPQYACVAVYHACRMNKIKISKRQIIEKSRLKAAQWSKLDSEFSNFVNEKFTSARNKNKDTTQRTDTNNDNAVEDISPDIQEEKSENGLELYEDWKRRMILEAYHELKLLEKNEKTIESNIGQSPRRSPRKTPQKYSPYNYSKSPKKGAGIRLLFP
ncbi:origin recognition complex subunit 6 [Aricia agestis]|uniref:origin recognition complex subunit 6 n=1 Tax=Aricia agestis TaxID=91739 RepID=UPI001C2029D8|nr:origin recognition complex subunit 6 [Aricia agestis]